MEFRFTKNGHEDLFYFVKTGDFAIVKRIYELLEAIRKDPFNGLGKPEPLKHDLKSYWSRRITHEHRLVYKVTGTKGIDQVCTIIQCRLHY
ncbi:Txe/YoeB family addiction module toxin [Rufibacter sediminis]|uniref:Putative mRNA interferase YoeB n=1 Tax=Rufibacter sediminis TaxID=2762756 RepID=A0ABR6VR59_9BACT|nr:Txe/YoeB family addiction module toxin [Rufibacter sediminis]MBC3539415.1 Txe/YoeB family addiction module toxin [Rufibacter sediminis]